MARCNKYFPCNFIKELGGCIPHPNRCEDKRWEVFFSITASFLVTLKGCVTSCLGCGTAGLVGLCSLTLMGWVLFLLNSGFWASLIYSLCTVVVSQWLLLISSHSNFARGPSLQIGHSHFTGCTCGVCLPCPKDGQVCTIYSYLPKAGNWVRIATGTKVSRVVDLSARTSEMADLTNSQRSIFWKQNYFAHFLLFLECSIPTRIRVRLLATRPWPSPSEAGLPISTKVGGVRATWRSRGVWSKPTITPSLISAW